MPASAAARPSLGDIDRHVAARLRELRRELGLTQHQLAGLVGISLQQAHKYETRASLLPAAAGPEAGGLGRPVSKLRSLAPRVRAALKARGVTTCGQLLRAAGKAGDRARLAAAAGIDPEGLLALVRRADLARVGGVGVV